MLSFSEKFVSASREFSTFGKHIPAPLFRRSFTLTNTPEAAAIRITGLGFYELFVNGKKVTRGILAPYVSNPDQRVCFDDYDLVPYLKQGENVIGVALGNGMQNPMVGTWNFAEASYTAAPKLAFFCEILTEGKALTFEADSTLCTESAVRFDNLRSGVHYDARLEHAGWAAPGYDAADWGVPIEVEKPKGKFALSGATPVKITEERAPVLFRAGEMVLDNTIRNENDKKLFSDLVTPEPPPETVGYLYDFGLNDAGTFRLTLRNTKPGQRVDVMFTELLTPDGKADHRNISCFALPGYCQRFLYYCRGAEKETFVPPFTYVGGRYAFVSGIDAEQADESLLTFLVAHSEMPVRGGFRCSDKMANTLFDMTLRSDLSNFVFFPTDCPHREKNGWTGDASASAPHMMYTFGAEENYREWLRHIRASQQEMGALPGIVPTAGWGFAWGNGPAWDSVLFNLPYYVYRFRGDKSIIEENAGAMVRYLDKFVSRQRDKRGLIRIGLGDWVPVNRNSSDYMASLPFTNGVMVMDMCRKAKVMFDAIGMVRAAELAERLGAEMKRDLRREYLDSSVMAVTDYCQSSQALGLYYGFFEPAERPEAFRVLRKLLRLNYDNFDCGFLGLRVLFHVLSEFGETDLAYHMITKEDFPSYGYWAKNGETTLLEQFTLSKNTSISHNHHFLGDINHWFIRQVLGITPNPYENNANEVLIAPHFVSSLANAEGFHILPNGKVEVSWKKDGEGYLLKVTAPDTVTVHSLLHDGWVFANKARTSRDGCYEERVIRR